MQEIDARLALVNEQLRDTTSFFLRSSLRTWAFMMLGFGFLPSLSLRVHRNHNSRAPHRCCAFPSAAGTAATGAKARRLAKWLAADWGNKEQAMEDPQFWAHIHVCFRPLPWSLLDGYSFYCESAYDYNLGAPYKTSVILLLNDGTGEVELQSFKVTDGEEFWMGAYEPELLKTLTKDRLYALDDACNTIYKYNEQLKAYVGGVRPGKQCLIRRGGTERETWLDSKLMVTEDRYTAWDIGRDLETDDVVWGPKAGPFSFNVVKRLDEFVPDEPLSVSSGAAL